MGKRARAGKTTSKQKTSPVLAEADDAMIASEAESSNEAKSEDEEGDGEDFFETPDEKRVRLAKSYLAELGAAGTKEDGDIQAQLQRDLEVETKRNRFKVTGLELGEPQFRKGHKLSCTCLSLSNDDKTLFSGGKDCAVIRWDVETGKKDVLPGGRNRFDCGGHFEQVLGIALVEKLGLLVSVGVDRLVRLWDPRSSAACIHKMHGHTNNITAVVVEPDSNRLFTASMDKSLKVWDLSSRRYTDTLLGHVAGVSAMDIFATNRPVTGSVDKTVRSWKVDKDTHLIFNRHEYPVDAVCAMDNDSYVSGSQDGSMHLWTSTSKKPKASATEDSKSGKHWVTALKAVQQSDTFFSGSTGGFLRTWSIGKAGKALSMVESRKALSTNGCINDLSIGKRIIACAIGKEHRFGRWFSDAKAKNGVLFVPLSYTEDSKSK